MAGLYEAGPAPKSPLLRSSSDGYFNDMSPLYKCDIQALLYQAEEIELSLQIHPPDNDQELGYLSLRLQEIRREITFRTHFGLDKVHSRTEERVQEIEIVLETNPPKGIEELAQFQCKYNTEELDRHDANVEIITVQAPSSPCPSLVDLSDLTMEKLKVQISEAKQTLDDALENGQDEKYISHLLGCIEFWEKKLSSHPDEVPDEYGLMIMENPIMANTSGSPYIYNGYGTTYINIPTQAFPSLEPSFSVAGPSTRDMQASRERYGVEIEVLAHDYVFGPPAPNRDVQTEEFQNDIRRMGEERRDSNFYDLVMQRVSEMEEGIPIQEENDDGDEVMEVYMGKGKERAR